MDAVQRMGRDPIGKLLVQYSLPAIAGFMASGLYQVVDRILVGRGVGTDGMAAVTSAFPLSIVAMAVGMLVGSGAGNRISVLLGQRDIEGAERTLGQALRLSFVNAGVLTVLIWLFTGPILIACGCERRLLPIAIPFSRVLAIGQMFIITLLSMGNILRVQGRPLLGLMVMVGGNALNAVLAALVIYVLHWGVTGVAIATAVSQAVSCLTVIALVQGRASPFRIHARNLTKDRKLSRAIMALGAPTGAMQAIGTLVFLCANHGAGSQGGTQGVAALGVLNTIAMFLIFPGLGVMLAMQPLVGYNLGAGNVGRVRALLVRVLLATSLMGLTFSILVTTFAGPIAALFTKNDVRLIELVRPGLPWFVVPISLFGISGTMSHYFLSAHRPLSAGVLLLGRQLLAMPLFLLAPRWFGFKGIYYASVFADLAFAIPAVFLMFRELAQLRHRAAAAAPVESEAKLAAM